MHFVGRRILETVCTGIVYLDQCFVKRLRSHSKMKIVPDICHPIRDSVSVVPSVYCLPIVYACSWPAVHRVYYTWELLRNMTFDCIVLKPRDVLFVDAVARNSSVSRRRLASFRRSSSFPSIELYTSSSDSTTTMTDACQQRSLTSSGEKSKKRKKSHHVAHHVTLGDFNFWLSLSLSLSLS